MFKQAVGEKNTLFDLEKLPEGISKQIAGLKWTYDDVGMSDSTIFGKTMGK